MSKFEQSGAENQAVEQPYVVEAIEPIQRPRLETTPEGLLVINGQVQERYSHIEFRSWDNGRQHNNPDIISFKTVIVESAQDKKSEAKWSYVAVDINHPEKELLNIQNDEDSYVVNGRHWPSLDGKRIYHRGVMAEVDPLGQTVVFHENKSVIVNNQVWQSKFEHIDFATSYNGRAYAVGDGRLVIQDRPWNYEAGPRNLHRQEDKQEDKIETAQLNKQGKVAAVVERGDNMARQVLIGDATGEKQAWQNKFDRVQRLAIDDETGRVAAFGLSRETRGKCLVIDDIKYELPANQEELDYLGFQNGQVIIEYKDALGQTVFEKITLKDNAPELAAQREREQQLETSLASLRKILQEKHLPLDQALAMINGYESLQKKAEDLERTNLYMKKEMSRLQRENLESENALRVERSKFNALSEKNGVLRDTISKVKGLLGTAKKATFGSSYSLSAQDKDNMTALLEAGE
jgi:hypothetical protein